MIDSDVKTLVPSLINYNNSDLFTVSNIASFVTLSHNNTDNDNTKQWDVVIDYLPLEFYRIIESHSNIYTIEKFDKKYLHNPKLCAYDKYGSTNMWRPLMILNRCPSITQFDMEFIKYYDPVMFSKILSVLISRFKR